MLRHDRPMMRGIACLDRKTASAAGTGNPEPCAEAKGRKSGAVLHGLEHGDRTPLFGGGSEGWAPDTQLGYPGEYPFTRGAHPTMYRGRLWTMRQFAGFGTAQDTNQRYRYLLDHGQTGLSVAFDLPTLMGHDSSDAVSEGEVGREGVAIDTLADMELLFEGIPLDKVSTSMTINSPAMVLFAMYLAVERSKASPSKRSRAPCRTTFSRNTLRRRNGSTRPSRACASSPTSWVSVRRTSEVETRSPSPAITFGKPARLRYRNWRSRSPMESAMCRQASRPGSIVDTFAPRLSFFFNSTMTSSRK